MNIEKHDNKTVFTDMESDTNKITNKSSQPISVVCCKCKRRTVLLSGQSTFTWTTKANAVGNLVCESCYFGMNS